MPILKPYNVVASFPGAGREEWLLDSFVNLSEAIESCSRTRSEFAEIIQTGDKVVIEIRNKGDTAMDYSNTIDGLIGDLLLTMLSSNGRFSAVIVCPTRRQIDAIDALLTSMNNELPASLSRVAPHALGIGSRSVRFLLPEALLAGYEFDLAILIDCDTASPRWMEDLRDRIRAGGQIQAYRSNRNSLERNIELESIGMRVQPAKPRNTPNAGNEEVYARLETVEKSLGDLTGLVRTVTDIVLSRTGYIQQIAEWVRRILSKRES